MAQTPELIDLGDLKVAHTKQGRGPDLLFIHGWPLNGLTWRNVVPHLSDRFTCHVIDLPGSGATELAPGTEPSMATNPDVVARLIDALGLSQVALLGHDSGGMVARYAAVLRPEQVSGLVVIESEIPGHHPLILRLFKLSSRLPGRVATFRQLLGRSLLRRSPLVLGEAFSDRSLADGEFSDVLVQPLIDDPAALETQLEVLASWNFDQIDGLEPVHRRIDVPVQLIWGEDDRLFFPAQKAREMQSQFGGPTRFDTIPDAKLFVHEEHPAKVAELAAGFLAEVFDGSRTS